MCHPKPATEGAVPAGEPLERALRVGRIRVVRVDESDIAEGSGQQHAGTGCDVAAVTVHAVLTLISRRAGWFLAHDRTLYVRMRRAPTSPEQTDSAGEQAHEQLCDTQSDIADVEAAETPMPTRLSSCNRSRDGLRLSEYGSRLLGDGRVRPIPRRAGRRVWRRYGGGSLWLR